MNTLTRGATAGQVSRIALNEKVAGSSPAGRTVDFTMDLEISIVWIVVGAIVLAVVGGALASYFSPQARADRRRRKSNARIVNKSNRPTVKFSVRTKKD
jgi:hypothetical protein